MKTKTHYIALFVVTALLSMIFIFHKQIGILYEKHQIKQEIKNYIPNIAGLSKYEKTLQLRNFVYSHTTVGTPHGSVLPLTIAKLRNIMSGQSPQVCSGMAIEYGALLSLYHIPFRIVSLAASSAYKNNSSQDTHVTVEVPLDKKWVVMDPTFNIDWTLNGHLLSITQLKAAYTAGKHPIADDNGFKRLPGRSLEEYYLPYQKLLSYIEISKLTTWGKYIGTNQIVKVIPNGISWLYKVKVESLNDYKWPTRTIANWDFQSGIPKCWSTASNDIKVSTTKYATYIMTDKNPHGYQIISPKITLTKGEYILKLNAQITQGGMHIGVLDSNNDRWIKNQYLRNWQFKKAKKNQHPEMLLNLQNKQTIQFILGNYTRDMNTTSKWILSCISINKIVKKKSKKSLQVITT